MKMMKKGLKTMMMMMGISVLTACGDGTKKPVLEDLAGDWLVVSVAGAPVESELPPFLGFNVAEKRLYGNAGCNSVMGELRSEAPGSLSFGAVASTKRMCADMQTEDAFLQAMGAVRGFLIEDEILTLTDGEGKDLITLKKK